VFDIVPPTTEDESGGDEDSRWWQAAAEEKLQDEQASAEKHGEITHSNVKLHGHSDQVHGHEPDQKEEN
jgi:hypothetical protein